MYETEFIGTMGVVLDLSKKELLPLYFRIRTMHTK